MKSSSRSAILGRVDPSTVLGGGSLASKWPEGKMNRETLVELLRGRDAHADPLACLDALPLELVGEKPGGVPNSIWQLLGHMNYWMEYELQRMGGSSPHYPEHAELSWPSEPAPATEKDWNEAVRRFRELLGRLREFALAGDEVRNRALPPSSGPRETLNPTVESILWQTMVHNSYHIGQVAMVRRALGAWPPPAGGDSW
jgi:uncharacterized damage-inducible protein DinB